MIERSEKSMEIEYNRVLESMGKGLVLFKVQRVTKMSGQNYHMFFGDKRKPPLDIAINAQDNCIEYISFFAQDEKVVKQEKCLSVNFDEKGVLIFDDKFSTNNPHIDENKEFNMLFSNSNIYVVDKTLDFEVIAYRISDNNYILVSGDGIMRGVILMNITEAEYNVMEMSDCI